MGEFGLALFNWNTAQVLAVQSDQIESAKDGRMIATPGAEQITQLIERSK